MTDWLREIEEDDAFEALVNAIEARIPPSASHHGLELSPEGSGAVGADPKTEGPL